MSNGFEQLLKKYQASFADKQSKLKKAWENKDILQLHNLLHKLAGSSGSYGYNKINTIARHGMNLTRDEKNYIHEEVEWCLDHLFSLLNKPL